MQPDSVKNPNKNYLTSYRPIKLNSDLLPRNPATIFNQLFIEQCNASRDPLENHPFFISLSYEDKLSFKMTCTSLYEPFFLPIRPIIAFLCCPARSPLPESPVFKPATTEYLNHFVEKNANKLSGDKAAGKYTLQQLCANKLTFSDAQKLACNVHHGCEMVFAPKAYRDQHQLIVTENLFQDGVKLPVLPGHSYWEDILRSMNLIILQSKMCIDLVLLLNSDGMQKYCVYSSSAPDSTINADHTIPKIDLQQLCRHIFRSAGHLFSTPNEKYTMVKDLLNVLNHPVAQSYFDRVGLPSILAHDRVGLWGNLDNFTCPIVKQYFDDMVRVNSPVPVNEAIKKIFLFSSNERLLFSSPIIRELYDSGYITMQGITDLANGYPSLLLMYLCEGVVSYEKIVGLTPLQKMNICQSLEEFNAAWDQTSFIRDLKNSLFTIDDVLNETRLFLWYSKLHKAKFLTLEQRKNVDLPWVKGHVLDGHLSVEDVLNNSWKFKGYFLIN